MKRARPAWLAAVVTIAACSSAQTGRYATTSWTAGLYEVRAQVSFRDDSPAGERLETIDVRAEVNVSADGPLSMTSSEGVCRDPRPDILAQQLRTGRSRSFECGAGTRFSFSRGAGDLQGSVSVPVVETIRRRGRCLAYVDDPPGVRTCVDYDYTFRSNRTRKGAMLQTSPLR